MPGLAGRVRDVGAVRVIVEIVDNTLLAGAAARREAVAPSVPGVLGVHEQVRSEDVVVFEFPETVERVQEFVERIEIPLIPEKAVVLIARRPGRPSDLL